MWLVLGLIAIVATFINLYIYNKGKDYKLTMAMGLSFTALTLCEMYSQVSNSVNSEEWVALMDVVPTMEKVLWFLTIVSILLNIAPIFLELKNNKWLLSLTLFIKCTVVELSSTVYKFLVIVIKFRGRKSVCPTIKITLMMMKIREIL